MSRDVQNPLLARTDNLVTVGDWLRFAVTVFSKAEISFAQGLHGPQEEALFLVGRHLVLEPDDIPQFLNSRLTPGEIGELHELVRRRIEEHVPIPYLVHEAWQAGYRFYVDERVLIPRSYIAELIPEQLLAMGGPDWSPDMILEIGTGSGALAIMSAHAFPEALVDAVDISPDALEVAEDNVAHHALEARVQLLQSDIYSGTPNDGYDLIIANPPYEPLDVVESVPAELKHEPRMALFGGDNGMTCIRRIMDESRQHLSQDGILVLEHGDLREAIEAEYPEAKPHVFALADGSDAVLGFKAQDLPNHE